MHDWQSWLSNGVRWQLAPGAAAQLRGRLAVWHPLTGDAVNARVLKCDQRRLVSTLDGIVVKRMTPRSGPWHRGRFALRPSRARRACMHALDLRAAGLPVAEPLAYGATFRCGLRVAEMLVTRLIPDVAPLTVRLRNGGPSRDEALTAYGALLGRFHCQGFSNRDLKDDNVLCSLSDPVRLWVADMDGVRRIRRLTPFRCQRDGRVLMRSLMLCGCGNAACAGCVLAGYNSVVPERLHWHGRPLASP